MTRCIYERCFWQGFFAFYWFCALRVSHGDCFTNWGEANHASPMLIVIFLLAARFLRDQLSAAFRRSVTHCNGSIMRVVGKTWFSFLFGLATLRLRAALLSFRLYFSFFSGVRLSHEHCFVELLSEWCCFKIFDTPNGGLLLLFFSSFLYILAFYLMSIFVLCTQHRSVISWHGCLFSVDVTTRHKWKWYILFCSASG